ncbi:DUF4192 domain-containing protein [Bifidobacterium sp. MA2]|uniref:DUF4192 domain-containing protein n=1 Tax=Bifidobacterium santillanense TaxID=2809028 RepID=A0ABS5UMH1_9BIFI|nr:DUF4192 domain-containing protein [Bifidobacterium santillanense]MBT1172122.1 DUF4192 domain-containing protein [Bifidobacterium santillanense]
MSGHTRRYDDETPIAGGTGRRRARRRDDAERMAFLDSIEPADEGLIEEMGSRLRGDRRERGPERANAAWMDGPLDDWLDRLDEHRFDLDEDVMAALAVGMNETLSIRDALILSMVLDGEECDRDVMMDIIARPHAPEVAATVRDLMLGSLGEGRRPDMRRCRDGITMLSGMGLLVPHRMSAQPLASIAYILWWLDDRRAPLYALRSLEADDTCSLAALVLSAADHDVHPSGCFECG